MIAAKNMKLAGLAVSALTLNLFLPGRTQDSQPYTQAFTITATRGGPFSISATVSPTGTGGQAQAPMRADAPQTAQSSSGTPNAGNANAGNPNPGDPGLGLPEQVGNNRDRPPMPGDRRRAFLDSIDERRERSRNMGAMAGTGMGAKPTAANRQVSITTTTFGAPASNPSSSGSSSGPSSVRRPSNEAHHHRPTRADQEALDSLNLLQDSIAQSTIDQALKNAIRNLQQQLQNTISQSGYTTELLRLIKDYERTLRGMAGGATPTEQALARLRDYENQARQFAESSGGIEQALNEPEQPQLEPYNPDDPADVQINVAWRNKDFHKMAQLALVANHGDFRHELSDLAQARNLALDLAQSGRATPDQKDEVRQFLSTVAGMMESLAARTAGDPLFSKDARNLADMTRRIQADMYR